MEASLLGFTFGKITTTTRAKSSNTPNGVKKIDDCILYNHFDPNETYYLFLLEGPPSDFDYETKKSPTIDKLVGKISASGYQSYIIASAITIPYNKDTVKKVYDFIKTFHSDWKKLIVYNGVHVNSIMPFGAALHAVNSGAYLTTDCFYDMWMNHPYYYLGHGYIGDFDCFMFPVDSVTSIYEYAKNCESQINWKTRFFFAQLKNMTGSKELPNDMSDFRIIRCTDDMDLSKETGRVIRHTAKDILTSLLNSDTLAWDTETDSVSWSKGTKVKCITLSNDGKTGYYIPFNDVILKSKELCDLLIKVFYSCKSMVGANIKFDLHWIKKFIPELDFFKIKRIDDVGQLSHALNSDRTKGLKPLSFLYTPFGGYDNELDDFKDKVNIKNYTLIPDNILSKYATTDAIVTWRIFQALLVHVRWIDKTFPNEKPIAQTSPTEGDWGVERWYRDVMVPCYPVFTDIEHNGIYIDSKYQNIVREKLVANIKELEKKMAKIWNVPNDFQFGSTQKMGILFEKLGFPMIKMDSKNKYYATSDECIQEWKRQGLPGIPELISYRENNSFLGTFIGVPESKPGLDDATGWEQFIIYHPEHNEYIINQSYNIMGTETFRHIAKDPNFQNIPSHSKLATEVKRCITVPSAIHYTIDTGTKFIEGGELDSVEVVGKGRLTLDKITDTDTIIPESFVKYTPKYEKYFAS